nr:MAG TPA: hypothetical protein [Caudoviricetes sp.]
MLIPRSCRSSCIRFIIVIHISGIGHFQRTRCIFHAYPAFLPQFLHSVHYTNLLLLYMYIIIHKTSNGSTTNRKKYSKWAWCTICINSF